MSFYRNSEGYADPTAGAALSRIYKQERVKKRKALRKDRRQRHTNGIPNRVENDPSSKTNHN